MRVYDYQCGSCGAVHEHFVNNSDITMVECKSCGDESFRKPSAPRFKLPGDDPAGFPSAYHKWGTDQIKRVKQAEKKNDQGEH